MERGSMAFPGLKALEPPGAQIYDEVEDDEAELGREVSQYVDTREPELVQEHQQALVDERRVHPGQAREEPIRCHHRNQGQHREHLAGLEPKTVSAREKVAQQDNAKEGVQGVDARACYPKHEAHISPPEGACRD